jgi:hypothetical protein
MTKPEWLSTVVADRRVVSRERAAIRLRRPETERVTSTVFPSVLSWFSSFIVHNCPSVVIRCRFKANSYIPCRSHAVPLRV